MALFKKKSDKKPAKSDEGKAKGRSRLPLPKFIRRIGGYFKGSWQELSHTKWPTRKSTWSLTVAVILFTAFLMLFIILVDYLFDMLFERLIL